MENASCLISKWRQDKQFNTMHGLILGSSPITIIVADYQKKLKKSKNITLAAYKTYVPVADAVVRGLHLRKGKYVLGDSHQNRILKAKKANAVKVLSSLIPPSGIANFEDLFDWTYNTLKINGIIQNPCLWVYDIALRIGQTLSPKIEPQKYVYLYAGAYKGAILLGIKKIKNHRKPITSFYPILRKEGAIHIENILCDYSH